MWAAIASLIGMGIDYHTESNAQAKAYRKEAKAVDRAVEMDEFQEAERKKAQKRAAEKQRTEGRRGRASTILSDASGLRDDESNKMTLLGAGSQA